MSDGFFYGVTLSATHKTKTWDSMAKEDYPPSSNSKLIIRQALLGPDAKPDELNVVQVETMSLQEAITIPLCVLKVGENRHQPLDIEFADAPVTFTLIQGSGPVHLIGQHIQGSMMGDLDEDYEDMEEMEEEIMDEEEGEEALKEDENKRKAPAGKRKPNEEEKDEDGEPKGKKAKMANNSKGKAASPKKNAKK